MEDVARAHSNDQGFGEPTEVPRRGAIMSASITHETAKTEYIEAGGVRYAYRRFGRPSGTPLVFCHRFRGTMDDWDPAVTNGFAREREVILFDNAGVGLSTGEIPGNVRPMADHLITFLEGLGLSEADLLGFSMGGYVVQFAALKSPQLFRRLILAGTGPGGGERYVPGAPEIRPMASRPVLGLEEQQFLFFTTSDSSKAASEAYWQRLKSRVGEIEPPVLQDGIKAQLQALVAWAQGDSAYNRLGEIKQPALVANGSNDVMVPTVNSFTMAQLLPNAQLIIYPDSGHGFLFQYPELFVDHALRFLR
jgi:pimeloyl-ACP methyl ester carboxylesterase